MRMLVRVLALTALILGVLSVMVGWSTFTALSALLTAITLVLVRDGMAARSRLTGFLTIAWLYWGLSYVSNLVEAVYFQVIPMRAAVLNAAAGMILALAVSGLLEVMTPPANPPREYAVELAGNAWWRIPVLAIVFFLIYLVAGMAIYHWVASFYAHRQLPGLTQLLRLQLCRGVLDIAMIYPVYRVWGQSRARAVWVSACVFTVLCGWGPLLLPNQFMPGSIRLAHAAEMGGSGIVFGITAAFLLLKRRKPITV